MVNKCSNVCSNMAEVEMDAEIEAAVALDVARDIDGAVAAYEKLIADGKATADVYINLALVYFQCEDYGFSTYYKIDRDLIDISWNRRLEVLGLGRTACGDPAEMRFWLKLFHWFWVDSTDFSEDALRLAEEDKTSLMPYYYIYGATGDDRWRPQAETLYQTLMTLPQTVKNSFVSNVLESALEMFRR